MKFTGYEGPFTSSHDLKKPKELTTSSYLLRLTRDATGWH